MKAFLRLLQRLKHSLSRKRKPQFVQQELPLRFDR